MSTKTIIAENLVRLKSLLYLIKSTTNWIDPLLVRYSTKKSTIVHFRNGYTLEVNKNNWHKYILHTHLFSLLPSASLENEKISFIYKGIPLTFEFGKYGFDTIFEIFAFDPYEQFLNLINPAGKFVLDLGAAFGDTAIYFLLNGAERVVAVEAFPGYYSLAKKNIENNKFNDKCELLLSAATGRVGDTLMIDSELSEMFGANMKKIQSGEKIPTVSLVELINKYSIKDGFLKVDTEGFEYDIILNTPKEYLRHFSYLLIEYHYGYEKIEAYLQECQFSYFHTGPAHVFVPHLEGEEGQNMYTGHIIATRID